MTPRILAIALLASACGKVSGPPGGDPPPDGAVASPYKGTMSQTPAVAFGGAPYCNYTITLKQLEIDLDIVPSRQVTSGRVQDLNVEGPSSCPNGVIPPTIANYTLQSAVASGPSSSKLTFQGAAGNAPMASLVVELSPSGSAYSATLTFHRTDQVPQLNWSVTATLALSPQ